MAKQKRATDYQDNALDAFLVREGFLENVPSIWRHKWGKSNWFTAFSIWKLYQLPIAAKQTFPKLGGLKNDLFGSSFCKSAIWVRVNWMVLLLLAGLTHVSTVSFWSAKQLCFWNWLAVGWDDGSDWTTCLPSAKPGLIYIVEAGFQEQEEKSYKESCELGSELACCHSTIFYLSKQVTSFLEELPNHIAVSQWELRDDLIQPFLFDKWETTANEILQVPLWLWRIFLASALVTCPHQFFVYYTSLFKLFPIWYRSLDSW